jgi:hypothetical protein
LSFNQIHSALEITAISSSPKYGLLLLECENKFLFHYDFNSILESIESESKILKPTKSNAGNLLKIDISKYLKWNLQTSIPAIAFSKCELVPNSSSNTSLLASLPSFQNGCVDIIFLNNSPPISIPLPRKPDISKVFCNSDLSLILCATSKPINVDFEKTGILLLNTKSGQIIESSRIKTEGLAIEAVWNEDYNTFILCCKRENRIFLWPNNGEDINEVMYPTWLANSVLRFFLNPDGKSVYIIEENMDKREAILTIGTMTNNDISWKKLLSLPGADDYFVEASPVTGINLLITQKSGILIIRIIDPNGRICNNYSLKSIHQLIGSGWLNDSTIFISSEKSLWFLKQVTKEPNTHS